MPLIDMYVGLKNYDQETLARAIEIARIKGLEGLVFAVSSNEERNKIAELKKKVYCGEGIKIFVGQKLKAVADNFSYSLEDDSINEQCHPGKTKIDLLVLWDKFLPENGFYDLDTLAKVIRKKDGIVLGFANNKNPNLLSTNHLDGVVISSQLNYITKEMWENFFKKPVYGGSGLVSPEEVGRFVTKFSTKDFKKEIKKRLTTHNVLMFREGKYIDFRNPHITLVIDPGKAEGLSGFDIKPTKIEIPEED